MLPTQSNPEITPNSENLDFSCQLTKIVATLGPASSSKEVLTKLIKAGVDVFRLNFSHGTHESHGEVIKNIREVETELGQHVALLQDLGGPKLRIKNLKKSPVHLHTGNSLRFEKDLDEGTDSTVGFVDEGWMDSVKPDHRVVLGDGLITLKIIKSDKTGFDCEVLTGGALRSRAGLSFPDSRIALGAMRPKDWKDLEYGLSQGVDIIGLSFVQGPQDILETREFFKNHKKKPLIVAKIERKEAVECIDEILEVTDGVMVARGDLGISIPIEKVPTVQKTLLRKAREYGKFSITATQMLESMIESPMPTRAEVTDVANAVLDGTDAVMLSGETALGTNPPHIVETMVRILKESEAHAKFSPIETDDSEIENAIIQSINNLVKSIDAKIVFAPFTSGSTAIRISRLRSGVPVVVGVLDEDSARRMRVYSGVFIRIDNPSEPLIVKLYNKIIFAKEAGFVQDGDRAIVTAGLPLDKVGNTNFIRAITIGDQL
jgi:pyruvate kinase